MVAFGGEENRQRYKPTHDMIAEYSSRRCKAALPKQTGLHQLPLQ